MKIFSKLAASLLISAALAITLSCSSDEKDSVDKYKYCVFAEDKLCLEGPFSSCEIGGRLSNSCPYGNGLSISSSSSSSNGLSSIQSSSSRNTQVNNSSSSSNSIQTNNSSSSNVSLSSSSSSSIVSSSSSYSSSSSLLSSSSNLPSSSSITIIRGSFRDSRDNKAYKSVVIGKQTWMAENLNYEAEGSKCYDNQESNCTTYGRLYKWETAMDCGYFAGDCSFSLCGYSSKLCKGICPTDWHVPTRSEWSILIEYVKETKIPLGWDSNNNGEDTYGFAALPGGAFTFNGVSYDFRYIGNNSTWWSSSDTGHGDPYYGEMYYGRRMEYGAVSAVEVELYNSDQYSVRCIKD